LDAQLGAALAGDLGIPSTADLGGFPAAAISDASESLERVASADELTEFLVQDADSRYADLFGRQAWSWWGAFDAVPIATVADVTTASLQSTDYSTTNIQVAGVDEGDLIKTDGRYLYVGRGPEVTIIDVQSVSDMRVLSRLDSEGPMTALYLSADRLTVISQPGNGVPMPVLADTMIWQRPWGGEPKFQVTVYDVSAPETPQLVSRLEIEGSYVDSRMIGDTVYLVSAHQFHLPAPEIVPGQTVPETPESVVTLRNGVSFSDPAVSIMPWPGPNPDGSGWVYETREQ
jgi:uncharacterized secreted protein with C-terminal beta-propeller domain